uniref:CCHC-type domain-containing protein n=1 Tax=Noccaea caerulescens TaxID=107243 RepID=A0A1J3JTP0_NOCCA
MEGYHQDIVAGSKVILDAGNYGYWKSRMRANIQAIDEIAWNMVEVEWSAPTVTVEGTTSAVPRERWNTSQRDEYKFNARALSQIHASVSQKQFELIQGCVRAKEAWDILQVHFEGTTQVQSSRKDLLATKFENLTMDEHESVADFSSRLSSLVQESRTLGKIYKDAKLVKKLLRCLRAKFTPYKAGLSANPISESITYDEMVGKLLIHEQELGGTRKTKGIALLSVEKQSEAESEEDNISLLVRRFDRVLKKFETGKSRSHSGNEKKSMTRTRGAKADSQCHECKGFRHFKNECPTVKRRSI